MVGKKDGRLPELTQFKKWFLGGITYGARLTERFIVRWRAEDWGDAGDTREVSSSTTPTHMHCRRRKHCALTHVAERSAHSINARLIYTG